MAHITVEGSSNIRSINTDGADEGLIVVEFSTGGKYQYAGVSTQVTQDFVAAESKGRFFAANIKGQFDSTKL